MVPVIVSVEPVAPPRPSPQDANAAVDSMPVVSAGIHWY